MISTTIILTLKRNNDTIEVTRKIKGNNLRDIMDDIEDMITDHSADVRLHSIYFYETEEVENDKK